MVLFATPNISDCFKPLEEAIKTIFIPAITGQSFRQLLVHYFNSKTNLFLTAAKLIVIRSVSAPLLMHYHSNEILGKRMHYCSYCDFWCFEFQLLMKHIRTVHENDPNFIIILLILWVVLQKVGKFEETCSKDTPG